MGTRAAQWHHGYNPVTHTGGVAPPEEKHKGVKIAPKLAGSAGNLQGAACIPLETSLAPLVRQTASARHELLDSLELLDHHAVHRMLGTPA